MLHRVPVDVDGEHFAVQVFPSDVRVNARGFFTSLVTVGTLKTWVLSALVLQMSGQTRFLSVGGRAIRTGELLFLAVRGQAFAIQCLGALTGT